MKNFVKLVGITIGLSLAVSSVFASDATSNRIKGVSEFLLERANDNYLFMLMTQIEENDAFKCYFPNTYAYATSGRESFKLLLTSKSLWEKSVKEDLEALAVRELYHIVSSGKIDHINRKFTDEYIELLQTLRLEYEGELYPLDSIPISAPLELRNQINQFYTQANQATQLIQAVSIAAQTENTGCVTADSSFEEFKESMDKLKQALELNKEQLKVLADQKSKLVVDAQFKQKLAATDKVLLPLMGIYALSNTDKNNEVVLEGESYLSQVLEIEKIIRLSIEKDINPLGIDIESKEYARFRRYIISFATLADAESEQTVKLVMEELALPPVSFGLKREAGENGVFISAYLGLAGGVEDRASEESGSYSGLFVPVGFEYSRGIANFGSLSIMLAPFDFAHPVNLEIEDKQDSVSFDDIVRPGAYFSYGMKDYPISFGLGVSKGRALRTDVDDKVTQYSAFVVIDMPLFRIF